jgi:hypothetical protein
MLTVARHILTKQFSDATDQHRVAEEAKIADLTARLAPIGQQKRPGAASKHVTLPTVRRRGGPDCEKAAPATHIQDPFVAAANRRLNSRLLSRLDMSFHVACHQRV